MSDRAAKVRRRRARLAAETPLQRERRIKARDARVDIGARRMFATVAWLNGPRG